MMTTRLMWRTREPSSSSRKVPTASVSCPGTSRRLQQLSSVLTVKKLSRKVIHTRETRRGKTWRTPCLPVNAKIQTNLLTGAAEPSYLCPSSAQSHQSSYQGPFRPIMYRKSTKLTLSSRLDGPWVVKSHITKFNACNKI